jgi:arginyl-tRNA synthetase
LALEHTSPNLVCEYLFELAQRYNALYNDLPILTESNDRSKTLRLQITKQVRDLLKTGLWILAIEAPEKV